MRYGSLFSGIEAASLAWRPLGWTCAWVAEIDPFCRALLKHHYPDVPNLGDVTKVDWNAIEPVDVIVGGSPCQSFSIAGKRLGLDDPRGNLAIVMLRIVERMRPRWVLYENVPGLLSSDEGRDFGAFLGLLGELGYGFAYRVLDAQHGGVPQRRRRLWVVGHSGGQWQRAAAVLFDAQSLRGDSPPRREAWEGIARPITPGSPGGSGYRNDADTADNLIVHSFTGGASDCISLEDIAHPITGRNGDPGMVAYGIRSDASREGTALTPSPDAEGRVRLRDPGLGISEELAPTIDGSQPHTVAYTLHGADKTVSTASETEVSSALRSRTPGTMENSTTTIAMQQAGVRRLTPVECERLMGMPDNYTLVPYQGKPAADGPRYKAIGNSMVVSEVRWIGERIQLVDEI